MKSLHQSLVDYELGQLQAIAECRAVPLATSNRSEAVDLLAEALLSPAATAIVLADLSPAEREALQLLLDHGGNLEEPRFTRQFGVIRPMGPARMARERPWEEPVNPAEGLWYRGLMFRTFLMTDQGNLEIFYIPDDLLELLTLSDEVVDPSDAEAALTDPQAGDSQASGEWALSPTDSPAVILYSQDRLRENVFNLLVLLQTRPTRLQKDGQLTVKDKQSLAGCLLPPLLPAFPPEAELEFLLHLGRRAGLLIVSHGRLRPDREPARSWLQAHPGQQIQTLQNAWRADPTWNDLWHVPGLVPQPTGWENSPLRARSKILDYLRDLETGPESWFAIDGFVRAIKAIDPDFQRPDGDYESWYIQDDDGQYLMGFENWNRVEGALIRYILTNLLSVLGVVELGLPAEDSAPVSFRVTPLGVAFLANEELALRPDEKPAFLRVDNNFYTSVPTSASLYDRFQLARFAELDRREPSRVIYQITQASVGRAMRNGVTADQIVAFLARATNNRTPLKVVETLRNWGQRRDAVQLERATVLRLKQEELAEELRQQPELAPLLGERIGPKAFLIPSDRVTEIRRLLIELGYLEN